MSHGAFSLALAAERKPGYRQLGANPAGWSEVTMDARDRRRTGRSAPLSPLRRLRHWREQPDDGSMLRSRLGFSLIELVVVMLMIAVVVTISLPSALRPSPANQVDSAARALTRDLEQLRMRAIAAKRHVRVSFDRSGNFYTAFMDITPARLVSFSGSSEEVRASGLLTRGSNGGVPGVPLARGVVFGVGDASSGPRGASASDAITLEGGQVEFDSRGLVTPPGSGGVVYLTHEDDPGTVAAVTISGASAFRTWRYRAGRWIR